MQMKTKILFSLLVASSLFSCGEEGNESGDGINPFVNQTYIRFVSPVGTNVIDSLGVLNMKERLYVLLEDTDLLTITGTRMSDGQPLEFNANHWLWASEKNDPLLKRTETLARLEWLDFNAYYPERHPYEYDEIYEINLSSPELFGKDVTHTLRWYAKVKGKVLNAYKCELDGKEVSLDDDPFYNYTSPYWTMVKNKFVTALIDIKCK